MLDLKFHFLWGESSLLLQVHLHQPNHLVMQLGRGALQKQIVHILRLATLWFLNTNFSMIPCSDNCRSFINEVPTVEFIPIISFIALVGLVVGFMKALLHFKAVTRGFLCLYQALQSAWSLVCSSICDFCSGVTNNLLLILSTLSLFSARETGWHLGGLINSSLTSLLWCDLETRVIGTFLACVADSFLYFNLHTIR